MLELNLTYLQTNPILEGVRGNLYEINFYFSAAQIGFLFSEMFIYDEEGAPSVVKYTLAVRKGNRNTGMKYFSKCSGPANMIKLSYQRRVPSFRSFGPPGLRSRRSRVHNCVARSRGVGGGLTLDCFPPPSMEARTLRPPT